MRHITARELYKLLQQAENPPPCMLDVRELWERSTCAIESSVHMPMRLIDPAYRSLNPEEPTVVICHHGVRSRAVASFLEHQGFKDVINLAGGIDAWAREVDPEMPVY